MNVLAKAYSRCMDLERRVSDDTLRLKQSILGSEALASTGLEGLRSLDDSRRQERRLAMYRGWLYSAVHALAWRAAFQPVNLSRLLKATDEERGERRTLNTAKRTRHLNKMNVSAYSKAVNREMEVLDSHHLLDSLEQPNEWQSRSHFVYSFIVNLNLTGRAYVISALTKDGKREFVSLPTSWVNPNSDFTEFEVRNPKRPEAKGEMFKRDQVGFAYMPDPSDPKSGLPPVLTQVLSIQVDENIQASQRQLFSQGVFPGLIIKLGKQPLKSNPSINIRPKLTPAQRRQINTAVMAQWRGTENYGHPLILDQAIEEVERLSMTQNELGWEKSEDKVRARILSAFGINPFLLGEIIPGSYAQSTNVLQVFFDRVNGFLDMLGCLMSDIVNRSEDNSLLVWWDRAEAVDPQLQLQRMNTARANGDITQDEYRAWIGFPPDEDLNQREIAKGEFPAVVQLLAQVGTGAITPQQAEAAFISLGLSSERANQLAGTGPATEQQVLQEATDELRSALDKMSLVAAV